MKLSRKAKDNLRDMACVMATVHIIFLFAVILTCELYLVAKFISWVAGGPL